MKKGIMATLMLLAGAALLFAQDEVYEVRNPGESKYQHTSEHFVARWNDRDNVTLSQQDVAAGLENLEACWDTFINELGFEKPLSSDTSPM